MDVEDIADRLRRLRRESSERGRRAPRETLEADLASAESNEPRSIHAALARRDSRVRRRAPEGADVELGAGSRAPARAGMPSGLAPMAHGLGGHAAGALLARSETFEREHRHGRMHLAEVARADPRVLALLARDRAFETIELGSALYLDTETSGLAGGAGTYVFMVGLGSFEENGFRVWQGFLDDPAHESDLLAECAQRIRAAPAIVSYFGKSFDRHRLEDRMRCLRIDPPFRDKAHLDLYHPLRRLYRGVFADHRLRTLERAL